MVLGILNLAICGVLYAGQCTGSPVGLYIYAQQAKLTCRVGVDSNLQNMQNIHVVLFSINFRNSLSHKSSEVNEANIVF